MPELFGQSYSPDSLKQFTSSMDQLAGIRLVEYTDGRARGMRAAEVWNSSGLRFTVYIDRGMDIGPADFCGKSLAWIHPGLGTPALYEPNGLGFLRTFGGGLMTTCGLTHYGPPEQTQQESYGLHGRVSHIPAQNVRVIKQWEGDNYVLSLEGEVAQVVLYGESITLKRHISTSLNSQSIKIEDIVHNEGYRSTPHMMLYHCNFGFPVISPDSVLNLEDISVRSKGNKDEEELLEYARFTAPVDNYNAQVYFHFPRPDDSGFVTASIYNKKIGFGGYVRYRSAELPAFTQWKMIQAGEYVCGLEPCTNHEAPRSTLLHDGTLRFLEPGEEINYSLEIGAILQK